jgi:hypothetical protein
LAHGLRSIAAGGVCHAPQRDVHGPSPRSLRPHSLRYGARRRARIADAGGLSRWGSSREGAARARTSAMRRLGAPKLPRQFGAAGIVRVHRREPGRAGRGTKEVA